MSEQLLCAIIGASHQQQIPRPLVTAIFAQCAAAHAASAEATKIGLQEHVALQKDLMNAKFVPGESGDQFHSIGGPQGIGGRAAMRLIARVFKLPAGDQRNKLEQKMFATLMEVMESKQHFQQSRVMRFLLDQAQEKQNSFILCLLTPGGRSDAFAAHCRENEVFDKGPLPLFHGRFQAGFQMGGEGLNRWPMTE